MKKNIWPSVVDGCVVASPSKSEAQRAIALAALARGCSRIVRPGQSEDVLAVMRVCENLGARIHWEGADLLVEGGLQAPDAALHCGESGLAIRMFSAIAALFDEEIVCTGSGSLSKRPMRAVEDALGRMGVQCSTQNGFLPVTVKGPLQGGAAELDGSGGSQIITGLLMAAALAPEDTFLTVNNLKSKPYTDLTIEVMRAFGVEVRQHNHPFFIIPGGQRYQPTVFTTGGDWSGAAFMLVAGAVAGRVSVEGLQHKRSQPDKRICDVLQQVGAAVRMREHGVLVRKNALRPFRFDATDCPDLFPPLVALAAHCNGESVIAGLHRLHHKESDRALSLQECFGRMGIAIRLAGDEMWVAGGKPKAVQVNTYGDHRLAMAAAVAALGGEGPVTIQDAQVVNKSYPGFFDDLAKLTGR